MIPKGYGWRANLNREGFGLISYDDLSTAVARAGDANGEGLDTLLSGGVTHKVCSTLAVALSSSSEPQGTPNQGYRAVTASE
jgi:hypothetical protein